MKLKIVMTDLATFADAGIEAGIAQEQGYDFVCLNTKDEDALVAGVADADALLVVYATVTEKVIAALRHCKIIVRTGIGYNNIDVDAATRRGIMVANVPDYCQGEVADHTLALLLSFARKVTFLNSRIKKQSWSVVAARPIPRLAETSLGLYGCGSIAQAVAKRAQSFGIKVRGFDPYLPEASFAALGIEKAAHSDELFASCDFISLHAPLTPETRHIINTDTLNKMKKSAVLINTARGPLINTEDLYAALKAGVIAGAALDVLETEPPVFPLPLAELDNVLLTPHAAYYSDASEPELRRKSALEAIRALTEGRPKFWLNRKELEK